MRKLKLELQQKPPHPDNLSDPSKHHQQRRPIMSKFLATLLATAIAAAIPTTPASAQDAAAAFKPKDERMAWWREARFGMFITFGLYSEPGGVWQDGRRVTSSGYGEWLLPRIKGLKQSDYMPLAKTFNPGKWDAEKLIQMADDAGMKYLVFVTKFHDGFSMYDTKLSDWSVVKATPWHRDPMKELSLAAHKHGIKLIPYYSILDWYHPAYEPRAAFNDVAQGPTDMAAYEKFMQGQLKELQDQYGPLAGFWFDGNWEGTWTKERGQRLEAFCHQLIPDGVFNNRTGKQEGGVHGIVSGDFCTPELTIPANGYPGMDWESCMTMNGTWGWRRDDTAWKTPAFMIRQLIDCASKGGNFLVNVGPKPDGSIPDASIEVLEGFAKWMQINREAIKGTGPCPLPAQPAWGRITTKPGTLYLHLFSWPADSAIELPMKFDGQPEVYLLADPKKSPLALETTDTGIRIKVPVTMELDRAATVIVVKGKYTLPAPPKAPIKAISAKASSTWTINPGMTADQVADGNFNTRWGAEGNARSGWLELDLGAEKTIAGALVDEAGYSRTQKFEIQAKSGEAWTTVAAGTTLGDRKIIRFKTPATARVFRLNILQASEVPTISEFQLFE
jgi:alpha-L-fucosidase